MLSLHNENMKKGKKNDNDNNAATGFIGPPHTVPTRLPHPMNNDNIKQKKLTQ